jgi:hypothetical protein
VIALSSRADYHLLLYLTEMGRIWAAHYHTKRDNQRSHYICTLICYLIRAEASLKIDSRKAIAGMLAEADIPIEQFEECEAEPI